MTNKFKYALVICLTLCVGIFSSCSDDKDEQLVEIMGENQGQVFFTFSRINTYIIDDLLDMKRLKVTLKKDGKEISLNTLDLVGKSDSVGTKKVILDEGTYLVYNYKVFNEKGDMISEAYPEENNTIVITKGEAFNFSCYVKIRVDISDSLLKNKLLGICTEIWGNDTVKWPKTWREDNNEPETWENIIWGEDYYGNPTYPVEIIFDEKFAGMKKLPIAVTNLVTLEALVIRNIPEMESICDEIVDLNLEGLIINNTGLKSLPANFGKMKLLGSISITNSKLEEVPLCLGDIKTLLVLDLSNNPIKEIKSELVENLAQLTSIQLRNTEISSLPENFFSAMPRINEYVLSGNKALSTLPSNLPDGVSYLRSLDLQNCAFTEIPDIALKGRVKSLHLAGNNITSISQSDINDVLEYLNLSNNNMISLGNLSSSRLHSLVLDNNNFTSLPDISNFPELILFSIAGNNITEVTENYFVNNPKIVQIKLDNNASLSTISDNLGFVMETYTKDDEVLERPAKVNMISVNNCPSLIWTVPASWKHTSEFGPSKGVTVYKVNSPGVKY